MWATFCKGRREECAVDEGGKCALLAIGPEDTGPRAAFLWNTTRTIGGIETVHHEHQSKGKRNARVDLCIGGKTVFAGVHG